MATDSRGPAAPAPRDTLETMREAWNESLDGFKEYDGHIDPLISRIFAAWQLERDAKVQLRKELAAVLAAPRAPEGPPFCPHGEPTTCESCAREREDDLREANNRRAIREAQDTVGMESAILDQLRAEWGAMKRLAMGRGETVAAPYEFMERVFTALGGVSRALPEPTDAALQAAVDKFASRDTSRMSGNGGPWVPHHIVDAVRAAYAVQFGGGGTA